MNNPVSPAASSLLRAASRWPGFAAGAAVLGIAAPAIFSTDDRGYWRTSLLTSPVIAAGLSAAPGVWEGFKQSHQDLRNFNAMRPFGNDFKYVTLADLRDLMESGHLSQSEVTAYASQISKLYHDMSIDYYGDLRPQAETSVADLQAAVGEMFSNVRDSQIENAETNLSHAVFESELRAATPSDMLRGAPTDQMLTMEGVAASIENAKAFPQDQSRAFFENMKRRLTEMQRLHVGEEVNPAAHVAAASPQTAVRADTAAGRALLEGRGDIVTNLQAALDEGWIARAEVIAEDGQAIGVRVARGDEGLSFGLVDTKTGKVRIGSDFQRVGAGRHVHEGFNVFELDAYISGNLNSEFRDLHDLFAKAAVHSGRNVDDAFWARTVEGLDSDASLLSDAAIRLRYQQAIPSSLQGRLLGKTFGSTEMTHADRISVIQSAKGWAVKVGSESSLADLVLELREADKYAFGQFASNTQQDPTFRSMTKPVEIDAATIPADRLASVTTTQVLHAYGGKSPQFHMTVGGVTPAQKSLFGYLPADAGKLRDPGVEAEAVQSIMSDIRMSNSADLRGLSNAELRRRALASWEIMRNEMEANPLKLHAMRKLGSLGEGDFLVAHGLTLMKTKERGIVQLKSLHLDPSKHRFGQAGAAAFGPRDVIGYDASGAAITSGASENWFTGLTYDAGTESYNFHFLKQEGMRTGAKLDSNGIKGLATVLEHGEQTMISDMLNLLYETTGRGRPVMRADAFANMAYYGAKIKDPARAIVEDAALVASRFAQQSYEDVPQVTGILAPFLERMEAMHLNYDVDRRGFVEDSEAVSKALATEEQRAQRLSDIEGVVDDFFAQTTAMLDKYPDLVDADRLFQAFQSQRQAGFDKLQQFLQFHYQGSSAWVWNHTGRDMPRQVKTTFDLYGDLHRAGELEAAKEILEGSHILRGDTRQAWQFLNRLEEADFSPTGAVVNINDIPDDFRFGNDGAFAGSIFDPSNPEFRDNFSIKLDKPIRLTLNGREVEAGYIPVRGSGTFKAGANAYGAGERAATEYQRDLLKLIQAAKGTGEGAEQRATAQFAAHIDLNFRDLLGKDGLMRPEAVYPHAMAGAIMTRPATEVIRPAGFDAAGAAIPAVRNPFEAVISEDLLRHIHDPELLAQIRAGEAIAIGARHPISATPFLKVRVAGERDFLGPNTVGLDEGVRSLFQADDDGDIINLMFLRNKDSLARAHKALEFSPDYNQMSGQWKSQRVMELMQGNLEDSAKMSGEYMRTVLDQKSLAANLEKLVAISKSEGGRMGKVAQRLALGSTGAYSNLLTQLYMNLEAHPTLAFKSGDRQIAEKLLWLTRQVPISAGKGAMDLGLDPMKLYGQVLTGLSATDRNEGFRLVIDAVTKIAEGSRLKTTVSNERDLLDLSSIFGVASAEFDGERRTLRVGDEFNLAAEIMRSGKGGAILEELVTKRNRGVDNLARLLTKGEIGAEEGMRRLMRMGYGAPYLRGAFAGEHAGATSVSKTIGLLNDVLKGATGQVAREFKPAVPVLAAGFGVAAIAGLLSTPIEDDATRERRPQQAVARVSGNRYRPEERLGVPDRIPGEDVPGSASGRPNVRETVAAPQVQTAMVAPMRRTSDLEVRASAPNREAAADVARAVERLTPSGGSSNTTVNYVGGWRNRGSKLRMRQELREQIDQQPQY
jgi:hypothetical protein